MLVWGNCAVVWHIDTIVSKKLAVWESWICSNALFWKWSCCVEEIENVNISGGKLSCIDIKITKESPSFVHSSNISRANIWERVVFTYTTVSPAILLNHGHNIIKLHILVVCLFDKSLNIKSFSSQSPIKSLWEESKDSFWSNVLNDAEKNWNEVGWEKWRPVVFSSIDPAIKEVIVTIWHTFSLLEEFSSSFNIKFSSYIISHSVPCDMETSVFGLLDPVSPFSSLKVWSRPIPSILWLNNVELVILHSHGHDIVSNSSTSSIHDDLIKTIKSHDSKEISRLDEVRVNLNFLSFSWLHIPSNGFFDECYVCILLIFWHVASKVWLIWISSETSNEAFKSVPKRFNIFHSGITEQEGINTSQFHVILRLFVWHFKWNFVSSFTVECLNMSDLSVCKHDSFVAQKTLWLT